MAKVYTSKNGAPQFGGGGETRSAFVNQAQNEAPTGGNASEIATAAKAQPEDYSSVTYLDESLQTEWDAFKALVPRSDADIVAVGTGNWTNTDGTVWYRTADGTTTPPAAGEFVLIPQGVTVTYDVANASAVALDRMRIDGTLTTDVTADRTYKLQGRGTVFVDHTGTFECGTDGSPVGSSVTITFEWDCSTDMTISGDSMKLGRGWACFDGTQNIVGASKVHMARTVIPPAATDTTITLDRAVTGWAVGDEIKILGTRLRGRNRDQSFENYETETRTIDSIDNTNPSQPVITLSSALSNDHPHAHYGWNLDYDAETAAFTIGETIDSGNAEIIGVIDNGSTGTLYLKGRPSGITDNDTITGSSGGGATANGDPYNSGSCVVVNTTRNIIFKSTQGGATPVQRRPHTLVKGDGAFSMKWIRLDSFGRTDHNYDDIRNRAVYDFGENGHNKYNAGAWDGPSKMSARIVAYDAVSTAVNTSSIRGSGFNVWSGKLTSSSGGSAKVADVEDNGDGTGQFLLYDISGTFADNDTLTFNRGGVVTQNGSPTSVATTVNTNFQGRYALHAHRCGFSNPSSPTVDFEGCVVGDAAGWAFVHHDSHANISKCIAFDFRSAGFTAEGGGSIGLWSDCVSFDAKEPLGNYTEANTKNGGGDFGNDGHGYWLHSRPIQQLRNIAANVPAGWLWTTRTPSASGTAVYPGSVSDSKIFYGLASTGDQVAKAFAVIEQFEDCESFCCEFGAAVAKQQPNQAHDKRTALLNFFAWECVYGSAFQYTGHYTLKDFVHFGVDSSHRTKAPTSSDLAISIFRQSIDMTIAEGDFRGFDRGIRFASSPNPGPWDKRQGQNVIEPKFSDVTTEYQRWDGAQADYAITLPYDAHGPYSDGMRDVKYTALASVGSAGVSFAWDEDEMVWDGSGNFAILGTLTDSIGSKLRHIGSAERGLGAGNLVVTAQSQITNAFVNSSDYGAYTLLSRDQMILLMQQNGVYDSTAGDKVLLIPDLIGDRFFPETNSEFFTPVALRISSSLFNTINPADNGALDDGVGGAYEGFNPAGTPGLT